MRHQHTEIHRITKLCVLEETPRGLRSNLLFSAGPVRVGCFGPLSSQVLTLQGSLGGHFGFFSIVGFYGENFSEQLHLQWGELRNQCPVPSLLKCNPLGK